MSESVILANRLVSLWRTVEEKGVDDQTSVSAFTSTMWAELVSRGMAASDVLMEQMSAAVVELETLLNGVVSDL